MRVRLWAKSNVKNVLGQINLQYNTIQMCNKLIDGINKINSGVKYVKLAYNI